MTPATRQPFMDSPRRALIHQLVGYVKQLRFPWLLAITVAVFLLDLIAIDPIPFIDEISLALLAAVLASLKRRRRSDSTLENEQVAGAVTHLASNPDP